MGDIMRILVTRPKEDAAPLVKLLKAEGHTPVLFPFLKIIAEKGEAKALAAFKIKDVQALIVTSANGVRAFASMDKRRSFKVMAVGDASARAAREAGFKNVDSADGDVETLAQLIKEKCDPKKGLFLHIAGSKVAGDLKGLLEADGFVYQRMVLYRADKVTSLSAGLKKEIAAGSLDGVLLYSPRTAASFVELLDKAGLKNNVKNMVAYGLSAAVQSKLKGVTFKENITATSPDQEALLACLKKSKDEPMTAKKDDKKPADPKVIDAKAEDVKVKDAPKATDKKTSGPIPQSKKPDPKKIDAKKDEDPVEKALKTKKEEPVKNGSFKVKALVASVAILAAAGVGGYYTQDMWVPKIKAEIVEVLKLETVMDKGSSVSEEEVAALATRLQTLEGRKPAQSVDIQPLLDKISQLELALSAVKTDVSAIDISNGSADKLKEFKQLAARLEAVEGADGQDTAGLKAENERLAQLVSELNNRLTDVEAARVQMRSTGDNAQALIAALSSLREVVRTSSGFDAELKTLRVLSQGDVTLEQAVDNLAGSAKNGVASMSALTASFNTAANDIVRAMAIPDGAGWVEETVKNVTSLVSIRRAPGNLEGEGPLGIVARAEHNVRAGDLSAAVTELESLSGKPLEAANSWISSVKARLKAEKSISVMQAHILSLLGGAGGQG